MMGFPPIVENWCYGNEENTTWGEQYRGNTMEKENK